MLERYPHSAAAQHSFSKLKSGQFIWWDHERIEDGVLMRRHRVVTILQNKSDGHGMGNPLTKMRKMKRAMKDEAFRLDAKGKGSKKK